MLFVQNNIVKTSFLISVILTVTVNVHGASDRSGEKTLNIKIGFNLVEGSNGPSLRIHNFDETLELKHRASEKKSEESHPSKPAIRADSFSDSSSREKSKEPLRADKSGSDSESNDLRAIAVIPYLESSTNELHDATVLLDSGVVQYSTRGMMNPNEYEQEERAAAIKKMVPDSSDSNSDKDHRHKRNAFFDHLMPREKF